MTLIAFPTGVVPMDFALQMKSVNRANSSPFGGSEQVIDLLNERWILAMTLPNRTRAAGAAIEAFVHAMRGMTNTVNLWHFGRPIPRGTMRGSPISWGMAQGSATQIITTTAGATLLAGDMVAVEGLLLQASADCVADGGGILTMPLVNRLRHAVAGTTAVTWDRPSIPFRLMSSPMVQHVPGYVPTVSMDFAEAIS